MLDLDLAFAAALVAEGKPALRHAVDRGLQPKYLVGEGAAVFEFVLSYFKEYSAFPTAGIVQGKLGIALPSPEGAADFLAGEILNRKLQRELLPKVSEWATLLDTGKPGDLVQSAEAELRRIRQEHRGSRLEIVTKLGADLLEDYNTMKAGKWGIPLPWPTINEALLGMWPEDLLIFVARTGIGKCLSFDTPVMDPVTGVMSTIQQRVEVPGAAGSAVTFDKSQGLLVRAVGETHDNGTKDCIRLRVSSGRELVLTPNHPLLTAEGWREAGSLRTGESIALPASMPFPSQPVSLPLWEVRLLAILLAEGSYTGNHTGFTSADPAIVAMAQEAADALGVNLVPTVHYSYDFRRRESSGPNAVLELLRRYGIDDTLAKHKTIPDAIYRLPREQLREFLGVFWMCDGYVSKDGPGVTLASQRMVEQVQHLLLRFGVQSRVAYKEATCEGKAFDAWRLRVYSAGLPKLLDGLHLWGEKHSRLIALAAKTRNPNKGFPRVSDAFVQRIREIAATRSGRWNGGALKQISARLGWKDYFTVSNLFGANQTLMLTRFRVFCEVFDCVAEFSWLWSPDLYWDEVEVTEPAGMRRVFDLGMEPTHNFVANDVIVHNSWAGIMLAQHAWTQGQRVLFVTTEMSRINVARRFFALHLRLPYTPFRRGKLDSFTEKKFFDAVVELEQQDGFYIVGGGFNFTFDGLEAALDEAEPTVVVVDGAYLMKTEGASRTEKASAAFDELKRTGKRHKLVVAATSQFNREVKNNASDTISLDRIALTDTVSWNADVVIGINRTEDQRRDNKVEFKILKSREGMIGEPIIANWDFNTMRFSEIPKDGGGDADEYGTGVPTEGAALMASEAGALSSSGSAPDPFSPF